MVRISRELVEVETLLHESVQRVGRAVVNMRELAVSGLPASMAGSGSAGGGEGDDRLEALASAFEHDVAAAALAELVVEAGRAALAGSDVVEQFVGDRPMPPGPSAGPMRRVVHGYRCARLLVQLDVREWAPVGGWMMWARPVRRVWQLTQAWGFVPAQPAPSPGQRDVLAVDLTEMWCRSCLRVGERAPRDRTAELCWWCRQFLGVEGFIPPVALVQARSDDKTITEAMVAPYRQAHRDLMKRTEQANRTGRAR